MPRVGDVAEHVPVLVRGHSIEEREAGTQWWAGGRGAAHVGLVGCELYVEVVVASFFVKKMLAGFRL